MDAVLDLPPSERSPYLDQACPTAAVRRYVESLIVSYEQAGDFLEDPALSHRQSVVDVGDTIKLQGKRVGVYQIIEEIGEGGMGAVYRAQRADDQYQKEVAIKLVRSGFDTRFALARFKDERQILATLVHPNIARLLDGGSTDEAQPYFVMDYIQGQPLDHYCDDRKLSVTERLQLFRTVCSAVHYAHQNLVIHRDIKPGNILVTGDGTPKLLDFGIAKMLAPDLANSSTVRTRTIMRLFTPEYASPEQLRGGVITTASDIYSLGVVLYELLTGWRPRRRVLREALRDASEQPASILAEPAPEKPSLSLARIDRDLDAPNRGALTPEAVSATREGTPERLRRRLSGDLDNIVLMALRQDPSRRYASVEQLSDDIRRHLERLPVIARPDTFGYRSSKFIRRHKAGAVAVSLVALTLIGGVASTLREARIARAQRERAEHRFNDVRKLANSLMFDIHDAIQNLPGSTQARQLLVTNALQYLDSLAGESRGDLSLQRELADAYERVGAVQGKPYAASLGDTPGALKSYLKAHAIRETVAAAGSATDTIKYANNCRIVAILQLLSSDAISAMRSGQEAVSIMQGLLKREPANREALAELAGDYSALGNVFDGAHTRSDKNESAVEENYRKALEIDEKLAENSTDQVRLRGVAVDEYHIARYLRDAGYRSEALDAFNKALGIFNGLAAGSNSTQAQRDLATITANIGDAFLMEGDPAHALSNYRMSLTTSTKISDADPKDGDARSMVGEANLNMGVCLAKLGNQREALAYLLRGIAIFEKAAAADPLQEAINWDLTLAYVHQAGIATDRKMALADYNKALAIDQRLGKVDTGSPDWLENEAGVRIKMGDFFRKNNDWESAAESYNRAVAIAERIMAAHADRQEALYALADAYFGLGQIASHRAQQSSQSLAEQAAKWNDAKSWYQRSSDAWQHIYHPAAISPNGFDCGDPQEASRQLALCKSVLAKLGRAKVS